MTVLITGPTSTAGQYIIERLLTTDAKIRVLALPETLHRVSYRNQIEIVPGALEDDEALAEAVAGVDLVYHTAILVPPPFRTPEDVQRVNALGTKRLLEFCAGDLRRFVFVSTVLVYKPHITPDTWPVLAEAGREAHGDPQVTACGRSMIEAEDYVFEAAAQYGMEYTILRPTTPCGRGARFPEQLCQQLMRNPEATAPRIHRMWPAMQWIHGVDLARAAVLAASHPAAKNEQFLVPGTEALTAYSLLADLWEMTHAKGEPNPFIEAAISHRPPLCKFDTKKIGEKLGFSAEIGVRQCLAELLGKYEFYTGASLSMPAIPSPLDFDAGLEEVSPPIATVGDRGYAPMPVAGTATAVGAPSTRAVPPDPVMQGKVCVITGATSGIGLAAAEQLAMMDARVVLVGRDPKKGEAALARLKERAADAEVSIHYGDLGNMKDVRRIAGEIASSVTRIDVLINNAGALFDQREMTPDGLERTFAVNHMAPFLMTALLRDKLIRSAPSRVITVTSKAHRFVKLDLDDLQNENVSGGYDAYLISKLCNVLFTRELARRLEGTGVLAFCVHPGAVATGIGDNTSGPLHQWLANGKRNSAPPEHGARGLIYLARSPNLASANGGYFEEDRAAAFYSPAQDDEAARRLWEKSAALAGLDAG